MKRWKEVVRDEMREGGREGGNGTERINDIE